MLLQHPVASRDAWLAQRLQLLAREKELTRLQDQVARERRALPWVRFDDAAYVFHTPQGPRALSELFDGRSQLLVQHFMLGPGWEEGCKSCSFMADHVDAMRPHLAQRDVSFIAISRAPLAEIERFRQRMGWKFRWASSAGGTFNFDFGVSFTPQDMGSGEVDYNYRKQPFPHEEAPGVSAFWRDPASGEVYHCYSTYGRGVEVMMGTYPMLDLAPKGRDEESLPYTMSWVRHHDRYEAATGASACGCGA
ncbi:thioredoxin family protein [Pelomonas sp. KK5]|uniref:DUF899 domain-containing protein n=1 Tax=Pelomonas sp. KK5 TaxID=1855730 RepID=UPI001E4EB848|nr:thioredoxin family protein [Pelomonas sp. KK5]